MSANECKDCQYFHQHYTFDKRKIFRVNCGHCSFDRPRRKKPYGKACENYVPGDPKETAFATKEYLSKELLKYLLELELLPRIEDGE